MERQALGASVGESENPVTASEREDRIKLLSRLQGTIDTLKEYSQSNGNDQGMSESLFFDLVMTEM